MTKRLDWDDICTRLGYATPLEMLDDLYNRQRLTPARICGRIYTVAGIEVSQTSVYQKMAELGIKRRGRNHGVNKGPWKKGMKYYLS